MSGSIEFEANLRGDQNVKAKLQALIDLQRAGLRATDEQISKAREASAVINNVSRAQNTLNRAFLAQHQTLSQVVRGMSSLAHVGRSVLSIITSISTARIAALQRQENERELSQQRLNIEKQINDLLAQGVAEDDPRVVKLRQELESINAQIKIAKEGAFQDTISEWGNKFAIAAISVGEISNILKSLPTWRTGLSKIATVLGSGSAIGIAGAATLAAAAIIAVGIAIDEISKALGLGSPLEGLREDMKNIRSDFEALVAGGFPERLQGASYLPQFPAAGGDVTGPGGGVTYPTAGVPINNPPNLWTDFVKFLGGLVGNMAIPQAFGEIGGSTFVGSTMMAPNYDYTASGGTTKYGDIGFGLSDKELKQRYIEAGGHYGKKLKEVAQATEESVKVFKDINIEVIDLVTRTDVLSVATELNKNEVDRLTKLYGNKILPNGEKMSDAIVALAQQYDAGGISAKDLEGKVKDTGLSLQTFRTILDRLGIEFSKFTGVGVGEPNPQAGAGLPIASPGLHEAMINSAGKSYGYNTGSRIGRTGMPSMGGAANALMSIGPGDPNYNNFASYLKAAYPSPYSVESISGRVSRGETFQTHQETFESAQNWAKRNGLTIIVQGSLITERDLVSKVSSAIAQAV